MGRAMGGTEAGRVPVASAEVGAPTLEIQNGAPTLENGLVALHNFKHSVTI